MSTRIGRASTGQSQKHGFTWENNIREDVFNLPIHNNDTDTHDIPKNKNGYDDNENCSIKTTGSNLICCGDILRFYGYNFEETNTIIVIKYKQTDREKIIENIYEINYNTECHKHLFGDLPKEVLEEYVKNVKSIPKKTKGKDAKDLFDYIARKKYIAKNYSHAITVNPKVDGSQSRVQCSIPNFEETLKDFITYKSPPDKPNLLRGHEIKANLESIKRKRNKKLK